MAQRDLNFTPDVTNVVVEKPSGWIEAAAEIGTKVADMSAQSKVMATAAKAHVAFKTLDAQFRMEYMDDPTNPEGLQKLQEKRAALTEELGSNVPLLYTGEWNKRATELATQSDVSNEVWGAHQQRENTVTNFNGSIKTYLDAANKDGAAFGASNSADISGAMNFLSSRDQLEQSSNKIIGSAKTQELLKTYNKDYMKSFVSGVAEKNPVKATELLNSPEIVQHFTTEERGDLTDQIKRVQRQQKLQTQLTTTMNDTGLTDLVNDPNASYYEKRAQIDALDMDGHISPTAAAKARRVIKSSEDLNSQTDGPVMAEIINQVYDLNANASASASDYLRGVQNVQEKILDKQATGELTAPDAGKLNKQLVTLTNKRLADATQSVGGEFYEANQKFDTLPPEYRGEATRRLFYASDNKGYTKQQYNQQALTIVDSINEKRRTSALKIASTASLNDAGFLQSIKVSSGDITETARKYNITEAAVIRKLRMDEANRHIKAPTVKSIGVDDSELGDDTPAQPVILKGVDDNQPSNDGVMEIE